jgi:cellobiose phosphorylase
MPDNAGHPSAISGCEPYAFTNQYLGPDNARQGDSISGWITGTAGWMFRAVVEYFCGIKPGYYGFSVEPCLPDAWDHVNVVRVLRGKRYDIRIERGPEGYRTVINGSEYTGGFVPYLA